MPTPLDTLDPFNMKVQLSRLNDVGSLGRRMVSNFDAVRTARRALLPLPVVDRHDKAQTRRSRPSRGVRSPRSGTRRSGSVLSGGSGACVTLCGVARALEEAGIEPEAISFCSGSALGAR